MIWYSTDGIVYAVSLCQNGLRRAMRGGVWVLKRKVLRVWEGGGGLLANLFGDKFLNFCQILSY